MFSQCCVTVCYSVILQAVIENIQRQVTVSSAVAFKVSSSKMYFMYIFSATMCYFSSEYSHTFGDIDSRKKTVTSYLYT